ncbi:MAG: VWA domain-containing protein, partial [Aestuariivita sp.]|nr:VWA domain-containing protein [Aestuariivita sp.]
MVIDSGINEMDKEAVGSILRDTITLLAQNVDVDDIFNGNLVIDQDAVEKRVALLDFNQSSTSSLIEVKQNQQALEQRLTNILQNNPQTRNSLDQKLSSVRTIFESDLNRLMNDHNVVIVISDTATSPSASALNFFKENNIAINVIAIGERFNFGLNQLAAETGGDYNTIVPARHREVLIYALVDSIPGGDLFHTTDLSNKTIPLDGTIREIESVPEDTDVITIGVEVENGRLDDVIVRPSVGPSPVSRIMTSRARFYTISNSTPGRWEVVITGTGTLKYKFSILQGISLEINAGAGVNPRSTQSAGACSGLSDPLQIVMCQYQQICREEISAGVESEECADMSLENMPSPSPMP